MHRAADIYIGRGCALGRCYIYRMMLCTRDGWMKASPYHAGGAGGIYIEGGYASGSRYLYRKRLCIGQVLYI